jgi:hypothetical protein
MTTLCDFIDQTLEKNGLRVSSRFPESERLQKMLQLVCEKQGYSVDTQDIAILSSLIQFKFSSAPDKAEFMNESIKLLPKSASKPTKEVRFNLDKTEHTMVRRSQIAKLP